MPTSRAISAVRKFFPLWEVVKKADSGRDENAAPPDAVSPDPEELKQRFFGGSFAENLRRSLRTETQPAEIVTIERPFSDESGENRNYQRKSVIVEGDEVIGAQG